MKWTMRWAASAALLALLGACGGGDDAGDQTPRVQYGHLVSFGDSLSDVGSYAVSGVASAGGGKYTVNGEGASDAIWVERLAAQMGVQGACAARTGLNAVSDIVGFAPAPVQDHAECRNYAQGGARVSNPVGPGNVLLFNRADTNTYGNAIGQLTQPLTSQVAHHLSVAGGQFAADDLVTVLAGGNDVFMNLAIFGATVAAGGDAAAAGTAAVSAVTTAATELVALINNEMLAKGAQKVVWVNLPDVSQTPGYKDLDPAVVALLGQMVQAFNQTVTSAVASDARVLIVDAYSEDRAQNASPASYGLTNVTQPACDAAKVGSSLLCTATTLVAGVDGGWKYADGVHPTPYAHQLLAQRVARDLLVKGWL